MHHFSFEGEWSAVAMLFKVGLSMSGKGRGLEALGSGGIDPAPAGGALEPGMHTGKCSVKMPPDEVACSTQCPRFFRASVSVSCVVPDVFAFVALFFSFLLEAFEFTMWECQTRPLRFLGIDVL